MEDDFWVAEPSGQPSLFKKRKRTVGKRKLEFIGWGSSLLVEFLQAIGKDTMEKHSQHEVTAFINKYIKEKGLASAEKKKKILCDERLYALFGKKSIPRIKIHDMLAEHFAANHDDSDDSSDEENYENNLSLGVKKNPTGQTKKVPKTPKSCFAAIIPETIKLIYLKRSLIQELLKVPESFEYKTMGSFVRMKSDPNDIYQKNRFQLHQVTGVEKTSGAGDAGIEIRLRVSNFFKEVPISMLSDDNFSEEEVEDVRDRIKAGLLKRLTVKEVEEKAQILHVDITKHWIAREISLLQNKIDHANEKGWRRELFEYLDRRKMLQTPSEQEKLLLKIPEVIAEELEPEVTAIADFDKSEGSGCSPKSILRGSSDVSSTDASGSGGIVAPFQVISSDSHAPFQVVSSDSHAHKARSGGIDSILPVYNLNGSGVIVAPSQAIFSDSQALRAQNGGGIDGILPVNNPNDVEPATKRSTLVPNLLCDESIRETQVVASRENSPTEKSTQPVTTAMVIDLSDDESEEDEAPMDKGHQSSGECPNDVIWHYVDPQGQARGPFSLYSLKRWSDANYFHSGFRVWKSNQTPNDGVLLVDVLSRIFPKFI